MVEETEQQYGTQGEMAEPTQVFDETRALVSAWDLNYNPLTNGYAGGADEGIYIWTLPGIAELGNPVWDVLG